MKKVIIMILICIPFIMNADIFPKVGTAGLQFLKLGIDARAVGMGEAYTAVSDDISSVYWNPAGLAIKTQNQVFFTHTQWVADIMYEYFAASKITSMGTFALSASALHMPAMDVYEEDSFDVPTGEKFYAGDFSAGLTYSSLFTDKFSFGITGKFLLQYLDEYSVNGFSLDLGSRYNTLWRNVTIGMSLRNFGPNLKYELDNDNDGQFDEDPFDLLDNDGDGLIDEDREELEFKIPMNFSLGISGDLLRSENQALIASFQLDNSVDRMETYNLGLEYKLGTFKVRAGKQFEYDAADFSFGLGWTIPTRFAIFDIDYSYTNMQDLSESFFRSPHRISLKMMY